MRKNLTPPEATEGARVFWNDPDPSGNSGPGTISWVQHSPPDFDTIISLKMDDGGEVECCIGELDALKVFGTHPALETVTT